MFKSLKLYVGQAIQPEEIVSQLVSFGYRRHDAVAAPGDCAVRGGILDVFPITFELPLRIECDAERISSIRSYSFQQGQALWQHAMVIILPLRKLSTARPGLAVDKSGTMLLDAFVDIRDRKSVV